MVEKVAFDFSEISRKLYSFRDVSNWKSEKKFEKSNKIFIKPKKTWNEFRKIRELVKNDKQDEMCWKMWKNVVKFENVEKIVKNSENVEKFRELVKNVEKRWIRRKVLKKSKNVENWKIFKKSEKFRNYEKFDLFFFFIPKKLQVFAKKKRASVILIFSYTKMLPTYKFTIESCAPFSWLPYFYRIISPKNFN